MIKFSKLNETALKSKKVYSSVNSNWYCYYHALSGEDLKTQIITIAHKHLDLALSYNYEDITAPYKINEDEGLYDFIKEKFNINNDNDIYECINYIKEFYDDARLEYLGKPFFNVDHTKSVETVIKGE
jgi:hypothetical protein